MPENPADGWNASRTSSDLDLKKLKDWGLTTQTLTVRADTLNEEDRTVEVVMATETPVRVFDWKQMRPINEVLTMGGAEHARQIPLLNAHSRGSMDDVLGSVRNIHPEGSELVGRIHFADDEVAMRAFKKYKDGHATDVSVGYFGTESTEVRAGTRKTVNGREYEATSGPLRVTTKWQLKELSLVPIGGNPEATVREDTGHVAPTKETNMPGKKKKADEVREDVEQEGGDVATNTLTVERTSIATPVIDEDAVFKRGAEHEQKRQEELRTMAADDVSPELLTQAINEGWDGARAAPAFLQDVRDKRQPSVTVGKDMRENFRACMTDALTLDAGAPIEDEKACQNAEEFRGMGFHDVARAVFDSEHITVPRNQGDFFKRAVTTGTFANILGTSAYRNLQAAYAEAPGTFTQWAGTREVKDFKANTDVGLSAFSSLELLGQAQEFKHQALTEKTETFKALTYGLQFGLSRQMWINDDMEAFRQVPGKLGVAAKRNIDDLGYALLVSNSGVGPTMNEDSVALFSTARTTPNYATGAGGVLATAGLTALRALVRKIQGMATETLNITSKVLLVPVALEHTALTLVQSERIVIAGTAGAITVKPDINIHQNTLRVIAEPRLDAGTNGATAWYLVADPRTVESLVLVHLRGQRTPRIERNDPTNYLGIGWRVYHDAGVAAMDWRGIARQKGA